MWDGIVWFFDELGQWFSQTWSDFISSFAALIEAIPVPDFLLSSSSFVIPDSIAFFMTAFEINAGIAIIVSAYTARFLIRRIPVIG